MTGLPIQDEFTDMKRDRGFLHERTRHNELEKAFADHWEEDNKAKAWLNQGHGLLQNLLFDHQGHCIHQVTTGERFVCATVIQWLGTNCGLAFLQEVLRECGYYIGEIPKHGPLPPTVQPRKMFSRKFD